MLRLDPTCSTFTSTHNLVVERCLREHAYTLAFPILDKDIYHLPGPLGREYNYPSTLCEKGVTSASFVNVKSGLTKPLASQDYLKYFLYGASIYIACRQWDRALGFLEIILAAPVATGHISMIQVEAYKRWCLVSVLVHGRVSIIFTSRSL
jgi:COP9 signalosome complex subunit 3